MAWGEEPAKKSLCSTPLLELETRAREPAAALGVTQAAGFTCRPGGPDPQLTKNKEMLRGLRLPHSQA